MHHHVLHCIYSDIYNLPIAHAAWPRVCGGSSGTPPTPGAALPDPPIPSASPISFPLSRSRSPRPRSRVVPAPPGAPSGANRGSVAAGADGQRIPAPTRAADFELDKSQTWSVEPWWHSKCFWFLFCCPGAGGAERWQHPWERGAAHLLLQALPGLEAGVHIQGVPVRMELCWKLCTDECC